MDDIRSLIHQVLDQAYLMSLATVDESGPWVSDLVFVADDDLTIYWLSQPNTRHSQAILKNSQVAASITVSNNQGEDNIAIQLSGIAAKIDGNITPVALKHLAKRNKAATNPDDVFLPGQSWYCLKPTKIDLIYEPLYGYTKKTLNL